MIRKGNKNQEQEKTLANLNIFSKEEIIQLILLKVMVQ